MTYYYESELRHWGIPGMKWGERRYRNEDGTLTEAGKLRYYKDTYAMKDDAKKQYDKAYSVNGNKIGTNAASSKWVNEDIQTAIKTSEGTRLALTNAKNLGDEISKQKKNPRLNLSSMTDKEMRDKINRELLERQYKDVFNAKKVSKGKERLDKILSIAIPVAGLTSTALGIALAIKQLAPPKMLPEKIPSKISNVASNAKYISQMAEYKKMFGL